MNVPIHYEPHPDQSVPLLKALHILTREGKMNQDSRRKLKQVYHLYQFIEPLLLQVQAQHADRTPDLTLVDHGAGKSYLGFILYDLFFKSRAPRGLLIGVERRADLVHKAQQMAAEFGFVGMRFICDQVAQVQTDLLPPRIDIVTALHACDTATDDAIAFALAHKAQHIVLVPCCQAELASHLRAQPKGKAAGHNALGQVSPLPLAALYRQPLHARELGAHLTNVLRCLQLQAHGYKVTVTELVGWEHSLKNELILASVPAHAGAHRDGAAKRAEEELRALLSAFSLEALCTRYLPVRAT